MSWALNLPVDLVLVRHVSEMCCWLPHQLRGPLTSARQGESEGNLYKAMQENGARDKLHGRHTSEYRLTDLGRLQAMRVGRMISEKIGKFDQMYCSEYTRAVETAAHMVSRPTLSMCRIILTLTTYSQALPETRFHSSGLIRELDSGSQRGICHPLKEYGEATRPLARWWVRKGGGLGA